MACHKGFERCTSSVPEGEGITSCDDMDSCEEIAWRTIPGLGYVVNNLSKSPK